MAYSRWGTSTFYSYWADTEDEGQWSREDQIIRVLISLDHDYGYSYQFIKDTGVREAAAHLAKQYNEDSGLALSDDEISELSGYFTTFLESVDECIPQ